MLNHVMIKGTRFTLLLLCLVLSASVPSAPVQPPQPLNQSSNIRYVSIPQDVSRDEVVAASLGVKERLHKLIKEELQSDQPTAQDLLVVLVDRSGSPILPDVQGAGGKQRHTRNSLRFTFHSQDYPWSSTQLKTLTSALTALYPAIKEIYGDPAFDINVNVQRDPTIPSSGLYNASLNEITIRVADPVDVNVSPGVPLDILCHEVIHAFRDDDIITLGTFEEGMARAVEVEVFSGLKLAHWDQNHSYTYDVYYEALNEPAIGCFGGNIDSGYPGVVLLRYQLAGYAWAKVMLENPDFFASFNQQLYLTAGADRTTTSTEATLLDIVAGVQPAVNVEGDSFLAWYGKQNVFSTAPDTGYMLYQRINQYQVDLFYRNDYGVEVALPSANVRWNIYDFQGELLSLGTGVTSAAGWFDVTPVPQGYTGRIEIEASTSFGRDKVRDTALRSMGNESGVFGIVTHANDGTVTITPLDDPGEQVTVNVVNGAFSAPSLASIRGRFQADFSGAAGKWHSRLFTKDASNYYLIIKP